MITIYKPNLNIKAGLFLFVLLSSVPVFSQPLKCTVLSRETNSWIGFVNIGIVGKNIGTVSDEFGNFMINLDNIYDNDSIRFSMIGYESKSFLVSHLKEDFKEDSIIKTYLTPKNYTLPEIKVIYRKPKIIRLGNPVISNDLRSGFESNDLGSELGIKTKVKGRVVLKDINLNVAICTFDSVTYRLNIYQSVNQTAYKNILTKPIYISFTKDKINNVISFDLSKYSITVDGDVLIALELYKDLGEGKLLFLTQFFTGTTYHRKTSKGNWSEASGVIGMYLHGQLLR